MFTTHGHWFAPAVAGEQPPAMIARCGGPALCPDCASESGYVNVLDQAPPPFVPLTAAPEPGVLEVPVDELRDWYQRYLELKDAEAKIKDMVAEARATFLDALARRHADLPDKVNMTIAGRPVLQRQVVLQNRVDTTRLRSEHPELAKQYSKQVRQERLNIL